MEFPSKWTMTLGDYHRGGIATRYPDMMAHTLVTYKDSVLIKIEDNYDSYRPLRVTTETLDREPAWVDWKVSIVDTWDYSQPRPNMIPVTDKPMCPGTIRDTLELYVWNDIHKVTVFGHGNKEYALAREAWQALYGKFPASINLEWVDTPILAMLAKSYYAAMKAA